MLVVIGTRFHRYTIEPLVATECGGHGVWVVPMSYDDLFAAPLLPAGAYLFTDIERLSAHERLLAAHVYRAMAGRPDAFHPINDPARVRTRYGLLRALADAGLNRFDAYRASGQPRPRRFPVFLKSESNHDPAVTDLLPDQAALEQALDRLEADGQPLDGLVVIEFAGEAVRPGVWARYTAFRVGDAILLDLPVTEGHWMVKAGEIGLGDDDMYWEHDAMVRENHHADMLRQAFELGRVEYGRLDFGLVAGQPQIYEINTNPNVPWILPPHPSDVRQGSRVFTWERLTRHLAALARPSLGGEPLEMDGALLLEYRRNGGGAPMGWRP